MATALTETRPTKRRRATVLIAVLALVAAGAWGYRATAPRLETEGGNGIAMPILVGDTANVGMLLRASHGSLRLSGASMRGPSSDLPVDFVFTARGPGDDGVGTYEWSVDSLGYELENVPGATVDSRGPADGSFWLIASFTPQTPGVYRFDGVTIEHGSWLRHFRDTLHYDLCIVAVEHQRELQSATDVCEPEQ